MASQRVLIVGGVAGGASCAARLRRLDERAEIFLYERGPDISFANCGLPYHIGGVIPQRQQLLVATTETFRDTFNVEVRTRHEVTKIHRQERTVEVRNVSSGALSVEPYDCLVLSPGAAPIRPRVAGIDLPGVFSLRTLEDTDRILEWIGRRNATRAVVVGAGYIGLEMVENLVERGMEVTVLELLSQIMPPMDPEMVAPVQEAMIREGVDLQAANGLAALEEGPDGTINVIGRDGRKFNAEIVILAIGVAPDVKLAKEAGLEIGALGGIRVDEHMRTSDPHIFAVGDAVEVRDWITGRWSVIPLAGPASRQGRIAADVICGRDSKYRGSQGTGVVGLFGYTLATTGANEKTLRRLSIPHQKVYTHTANHATYYPGAEVMAMKVLFDPDSGRILGAQAVGGAGVEKRIDVIAMAMQKHGTVYDLEEAELCYAPQYGSARDPVNIAGFVAGNVLRGDVDVVHWEDWLERQKSGQAKPLVVDVRPASAAAVVPGTVTIPLGELRARLGELPKDQEIWVHCGVGRNSYYASRILSQNGFKVRNLSGGFTSYTAMPKEGC
ncbi:MAG: FAD-dependent oxidoreductase [Rhodopirellula sp.]|nr:FAD-dependent oxidoreductase [Rhodopirellula sp.]